MVVKAIQESKPNVPLNKTWALLHQELGVGDIANKKLRLTASDRSSLSKIVSNETGSDPATIDLSILKTATRVQANNFVINEKWSGRKIKEDILYIRSLTDSVKLEVDYRLPQNSYLAVTWQQAKKHQHSTFVIIENLEIFLIAEQIKWPRKFLQLDPLLIYRGDNEVTPAAVKNFIANNKQSYFVFFDYDPAGLVMALSLPKMPSIIIPDMSAQQLKLHTKKQAFNEQINARVFLDKLDSSHIYYDQVSSIIRNHLAVMQERMISKGIDLKIAQ